MSVIEIDSKAYNEIKQQLDDISILVKMIIDKGTFAEESSWADGTDIENYLCVSRTTLWRLRKNGYLTVTRIGGRCFYNIKNLRELISQKVVRSKCEYIDDLKSHGKIVQGLDSNPINTQYEK